MEVRVLDGREISRWSCQPPPEAGALAGVELLEQVQLVRPRNGFDAVTDAQFAVGTRDVTLDGGEADEQLIGDLLVPHSVRNES